MQLPSLQLVLTFTAWLTLNIGLNLYNSYVLRNTNFRFPFLLTIGNKTVGLIVAICAMCASKGLPNPRDVLEEFKRPLVHVQGVFSALNIGLNNASLVLITLALNQVLKTTIPLPTALFSVLLEKASFKWQLYGSMLVLVLGCGLAASGELTANGSAVEDTVIGIVLCMCSVLATAMWNVTSAMLLQQGAKPLDAVSLLFVSGPTTILTLLVFFAAMPSGRGQSSELLRLANPVSDPLHPTPPVGMLFLYLAGAAAMASLYDIAHNHFVKLTSSMNMAIIGNAKLALLILLPMVIPGMDLNSAPAPIRFVGVGVAFAGTVWYTAFKLLDVPAKPKEDDLKTPLADAEKGKAAPTEASKLLSSKR